MDILRNRRPLNLSRLVLNLNPLRLFVGNDVQRTVNVIMKRGKGLLLPSLPSGVKIFGLIQITCVVCRSLEDVLPRILSEVVAELFDIFILSSDT